MASVLDALFGRIFNAGVELDLVGGLNMVAPLKATLNNAAGRIDIKVDEDLLTELIGELSPPATGITYDYTGNVVVTGETVQAALDQVEGVLNGGISSANINGGAVGSDELAEGSVLLVHVANGGKFVMDEVVGPRYAQYVCPTVQNASAAADEVDEVIDTTITVPNGMRGVCLAHVQVTEQDGTVHESAWRIPFSRSNPIAVGTPILVDAYESVDADAVPVPVVAIDETVYSVSADVATGRILKVEVTSHNSGATTNIISTALSLETWVPDGPFTP